MYSVRITASNLLKNKTILFLQVSTIMVGLRARIKLTNYTNNSRQSLVSHHPQMLRHNLSKPKSSNLKALSCCRISHPLSNITKIQVDWLIKTQCMAHFVMKILLSALNVSTLRLREKICSWKMQKAKKLLMASITYLKLSSVQSEENNPN